MMKSAYVVSEFAQAQSFAYTFLYAILQKPN